MSSMTTPIEDAIRELRADIENSKLDLDAKNRSLKVLEGVFEKMTKKAVQNSSLTTENDDNGQAVNHDGFISIDDLSDVNEPKKRTLMDDIKDVLPRLGSQEFNISHVDRALKLMKIAVAGKSPRSRISVALARLSEERVLARTFTGAGNTPNKYRVQSTMTEAELTQAHANNPVAAKTLPEGEEKLL